MNFKYDKWCSKMKSGGFVFKTNIGDIRSSKMKFKNLKNFFSNSFEILGVRK